MNLAASVYHNIPHVDGPERNGVRRLLWNHVDSVVSFFPLFPVPLPGCSHFEEGGWRLCVTLLPNVFPFSFIFLLGYLFADPVSSRPSECVCLPSRKEGLLAAFRAFLTGTEWERQKEGCRPLVARSLDLLFGLFVYASLRLCTGTTKQLKNPTNSFHVRV